MDISSASFNCRELRRNPEVAHSFAIETSFFRSEAKKNANAENEIVKRTLNGSGQMPARCDIVFEDERQIHKFLENYYVATNLSNSNTFEH